MNRNEIAAAIAIIKPTTSGVMGFFETKALPGKNNDIIKAAGSQNISPAQMDTKTIPKIISAAQKDRPTMDKTIFPALVDIHNGASRADTPAGPGDLDQAPMTSDAPRQKIIYLTNI